jgi:hypothetical protein
MAEAAARELIEEATGRHVAPVCIQKERALSPALLEVSPSYQYRYRHKCSCASFQRA